MRDNRTVFVKSLRLTPAERHCIDVVSQRQNLTLVEAARALIRLGAQSMGIWPEQSVPSPADKLLDGSKLGPYGGAADYDSNSQVKTMTWATYHTQSENYANLAETAAKQGHFDRAVELYRLAAKQETLALGELDPNKHRTIGITAVSAASLWSKARDLQQAQLVAYQGLATASLPVFAISQLQGLLQAIWNEQALAKSGIKFTEGEVLVSVSGGEVVT
jgi:hypothetical protein